MLTIAAMLSVENIYYYPPAPNRKRRYDASSVQDAVDDRLADAEAAHARLRVSRGDHFTLLNVYNHWQRCGMTLAALMTRSLILKQVKHIVGARSISLDIELSEWRKTFGMW